jgi:hypothetical protein
MDTGRPGLDPVRFGMSVFTAAELACLRQKPRLARIAAVTLFLPRLSYR